MQEKSKEMLFEIVKSQDALMQSISVELGVKTSLYLVFSVFLFNATFQINNFAKGFRAEWSERAVQASTIGAAIALLGAIALLIAVLVRTYKMFPVRETAKWIEDTEKFIRENPGEKLQDQDEAIREILEETVAANKSVNERKGWWVTVGAGLLFLAIPFIALAGLFSFLAYLTVSR